MSKEIIFSHSGSMFAYYLGIAEVLQQYDLSDVIFSGTSGGCFPCILLNSKKNIRSFFNEILNYIKNNEDSWEKIIRDMLNEYLTDEDIMLNKDKFICKLTKLNSFMLPEKVFIKEWKDKKDFVDCIVASCYVPLMCGDKLYIKYRNEKIIDGFFSGTSNIPTTDNSHILFYPSKWRYINPSWLIPSKDIEWLKSLYELGYNDTLSNIHNLDLTLKTKKQKEIKIEK